MTGKLPTFAMKDLIGNTLTHPGLLVSSKVSSTWVPLTMEASLLSPSNMFLRRPATLSCLKDKVYLTSSKNRRTTKRQHSKGVIIIMPLFSVVDTDVWKLMGDVRSINQGQCQSCTKIKTCCRTGSASKPLNTEQSLNELWALHWESRTTKCFCMFTILACVNM